MITGVKIKSKRFPGWFHFIGYTTETFLNEFPIEFIFYVIGYKIHFYTDEVEIIEF